MHVKVTEMIKNVYHSLPQRLRYPAVEVTAIIKNIPADDKPGFIEYISWLVENKNKQFHIVLNLNRTRKQESHSVISRRIRLKGVAGEIIQSVKNIHIKMKRIIFTFTLIVCMILSETVSAQTYVMQKITGTVTESLSGLPIPQANIIIEGRPDIGTVSDQDGNFTLGPIPVGRYSLKASFVGFEPVIIPELLVRSTKSTHISITMREKSGQLEEITVRPEVIKNKPLNNMALAGARMLSVEEASRYAGGMDDPARLVGSFAGVSPGMGNNGISVHGNAPSFLLWRLEDIEISAPNHFGNLTTLGGGLLSSLSSNVLGNSDFFTGAFPSEYSNGLSGVFDMKLRNGNTESYENTFQIGVLGIDVASEGPISRGNNSSYIFNYRYSTTGLLSRIGLLDMTFEYQDLNFKVNLPAGRRGNFALWGTALIDKVPAQKNDPSEWEYMDDAKTSYLSQTTAAGGMTYSMVSPRSGTFKTTMAVTYDRQDAKEDMAISDEVYTPETDFVSEYKNYILNISHSKRYGQILTAKAGATYTVKNYGMCFRLAPQSGSPVNTISEGDGQTSVVSGYISTLLRLSHRVSATLGVNSQYLMLNDNYTVEPRASVRINTSAGSYISMAYGLHSRMENADVYFVTDAENGDYVNKELDLIKSHHLTLTYSQRISDNVSLKIEPYVQSLYDVPVIADSSYSILNRSTPYVSDKLVNDGEGLNYGVDLTLEKYMTRGFYYMISASAFDSKYRGGDGKWYNTRYNRRFIVNALAGKEFTFGKAGNRTLGLNVKLTCQGGDRYTPVDEEATMADPFKKTVYDETLAYSRQFSPALLFNYTVSYRVSGKRLSREIAVKALNATGYKEYFGHEYNIKTGCIEPRRLKNSMINVIYRLEF